MSVVPSQPSSDPHQARTRQLAEAALVVGDYEVAEEAALAVHKSHPNVANTALLGRVYYFAEEWELAQPLLERAAKTHLPAQILLGWTHVFLGLWQDGEEAILRGQAIHEGALNKLDLSLNWLRPHLALMNYNYLVAGQNPTLGTRWSKARLTAAALEIGNYAAADELTQDDSSMLYYRARLFYHWKRWDQAIRILAELESTPEHQLSRGWNQLLMAQKAHSQTECLVAAELIANAWVANPMPLHAAPARRLLRRRQANVLVLRHRGFTDSADHIDSITREPHHPKSQPKNVSQLPRLELPS